MYLGLLPLLLPPTIGLLQHPSAHLSPKPAAGTTALASPPGFEAEYKTLREIRSTTSKPLLHLRQLEAHSPEVAQKLAQRVNFNVPKTGREAITTFFSHPTARFICCALGAAVAARFAMGMPLTLADGAAGAATGAFWMVQEWLIHDRLLHSDGEWFGERVHRWHHELPYYHVSLDGVGLAAVWFLSVATLLVGIGALTSSLAPCLTALAVYTLCGGIYEFAHYIAHTRVPLPAPLRKIRSHHTHHHTLSSDYWLAFTVPAVDSLFGTNPNPRVVSKALLRRQAPPGLAAASRQSVAPQPRRVSSTLTMCAAADVAAAGTSAVGATASATTLREELPALIQMARPNTIPMGAGLVILGAYGARHTGPLASGRLALGTLLTIIVTSARYAAAGARVSTVGARTMRGPCEAAARRLLAHAHTKLHLTQPLLAYAWRMHGCASQHADQRLPRPQAGRGQPEHQARPAAGERRRAAGVSEASAQVWLRPPPDVALSGRHRAHAAVGAGQHATHMCAPRLGRLTPCLLARTHRVWLHTLAVAPLVSWVHVSICGMFPLVSRCRVA